MVAPLAQSTPDLCTKRLLDILRTSELPGDPGDHAWIAQRITHYAEKIGGANDEVIAELLLTGFLIERGIDALLISQLTGRDFPEDSLRAVPPLLKIGCPTACWHLIEKGVLTYEGNGWGGGGRWVIRGKRLKPLLDEWHELGEQLVMKNVARGLVPLVHDVDVPPQVKINGVDRRTGRRWLGELRSCLKQIGGEALPHLMVDI